MRRLFGVFLATCAVLSVARGARDSAPSPIHPLVGAVLPMAVGVGPLLSIYEEEVTVVLSRKDQEEELQWTHEQWLDGTMAGAYWPSIDEAPWPDTVSVQLLSDFIEQRWESRMRVAYSEDDPTELSAGMSTLHELTEVAKVEGVITQAAVWERELGDDPWARAHQMMLYRAVEYEGIVDEDLRREHQGDGLEETLFLAEELTEDFPDHPAAHLARLILLEGDNDDGEAQELISTVLQSDDRALRTAAVGHYMMLGDGSVSQDLVRDIDDTLQEMSPALQGGLALQLAKHSVGAPADTLLKHLPDQVALRRSLRAPESYIEELELAAWRCDQQTPLTGEEPSAVALYWSGEWDMEENNSPFWSCLVRSPARFGPSGERVLLTVVVQQ